MTLPNPILTEHDGFVVVRDDLLPGGTKRRALHVLLDEHDEYVYASPVQGAAQLALAYVCRDAQKQAIILCAQRKVLHPFTLDAQRIGAKILEVPMGFLSHVQSKASTYCAQQPNVRKLLPFGLDHPDVIAAMADLARALPVMPTEVWSITSSGVLSRALQLAWPAATFYGVRVGAAPHAGRAHVFIAPEKFDQKAKILPPYPSNIYYDAKLWRFVTQHASPGALVWNVA
jgi:hypothetical protein